MIYAYVRVSSNVQTVESQKIGIESYCQQNNLKIDKYITFNLPDATNRVLWGATAPGYLAEQLPNITGTFKADSYYEGATGAFVTDSTASSPNIQNWIANGRTYSFNASRVSSAYVDDGIVRPNSVRVLICVKY